MFEGEKDQKEVIKDSPKKTGRKKGSGANDDLTIKIELTQDEKDNKQEALGRQTSYTVKGSERGVIHVELENVKYDGSKKVSVPYVQMYEPNIWHSVIRKNILITGYSHVRILHAPKGVNLDLKSK